MVKLKEFSIEVGHNSIRYRGNCKREYTFNNFIQKYPESHHDQIIKLWQNTESSYCYLLEVIREIKKIKRTDN
jgi:exonuclease I